MDLLFTLTKVFNALKSPLRSISYKLCRVFEISEAGADLITFISKFDKGLECRF